jgi:hypothetical protein
VDPKTEGSSPVTVLERLLAQAKAGDLTDVVAVFETRDGSNGVQASSMSLIQANHLWRVFDDRVRAMYRSVRLRAERTHSPTAAVSANGPKAAAIPRQVRRAVAKAQRKLAKKAARKSAPSAPPPASN